jgi:hypothetical protein
MDKQTRPTDTGPAQACAIDRSCGPSTGCGCAPTPATSSQRKGVKAAVLGVLCVVGCLAVPIAIGGFAALGGALAGEVWLIVAGVVAAGVVAVVLKRRGSGSMC